MATATPEMLATTSDVRAEVAAPRRNVAVDAYRGLVMLLMMGEVMQFEHMHHAFPHSVFWSILAFNQTHVPWAGLGLHDMIQPSFTFLVGVALPYSVASRLKKGQRFGQMLGHTIWRSLLLIALGVLLRSVDKPMTNYTFEDTLSQIGMGYTFAFLLSFVRPRWQWTAFGLILFAYWLAWALYPAPGPAFDYAAVGVDPDFHSNFQGFASHWNKNSNLGQAFDVWFLNLFPRPSRFLFNEGGYLTLSFIPTLGTMLLGVFAGQWLRGSAPRIPFKQFLVAGVALLLGAVVLHYSGICPIVKRIWTPAWVLFSGGICFLTLAGFSWLVDLKGHRKLVFPLVVVGMNSIAAYCIAHLWEDFLIATLHTHFGHGPFQLFGLASEPLVTGIVMMLLYWAFLYWMYRNKIFVRI